MVRGPVKGGGILSALLNWIISINLINFEGGDVDEVQ
jgi:hypothetical protein